jgi:hypothetical protein
MVNLGLIVLAIFSLAEFFCSVNDAIKLEIKDGKQTV